MTPAKMFAIAPELIIAADVTPYYAQLELSSSAGREYPQWGKGDQTMVSTATTVAVAVREDRFGDVRVEVWSGAREFDDDLVSLGPVQLEIADGRAYVGSTVGAEKHEFQLPGGDAFTFDVFVSRDGARVWFCVRS